MITFPDNGQKPLTDGRSPFLGPLTTGTIKESNLKEQNFEV